MTTNIKIKYKIWDVVEHEFNWNQFKVIWYNYIKSVWIKYICLQSEENDYLYLAECELKKSKNNHEIWFIINWNK